MIGKFSKHVLSEKMYHVIKYTIYTYCNNYYILELTTDMYNMIPSVFSLFNQNIKKLNF